MVDPSMFACEDWKTVETILPSTADASLISDDVLPNKQWDWTEPGMRKLESTNPLP
jgi:hypothetical protein